MILIQIFMFNMSEQVLITHPRVYFVADTQALYMYEPLGETLVLV